MAIEVNWTVVSIVSGIIVTTIGSLLKMLVDVLKKTQQSNEESFSKVNEKLDIQGRQLEAFKYLEFRYVTKEEVFKVHSELEAQIVKCATKEEVKQVECLVREIIESERVRHEAEIEGLTKLLNELQKKE